MVAKANSAQLPDGTPVPQQQLPKAIVITLIL
jgi:hypothetical protein